jgi:hypothetical protein
MLQSGCIEGVVKALTLICRRRGGPECGNLRQVCTGDGTGFHLPPEVVVENCAMDDRKYSAGLLSNPYAAGDEKFVAMRHVIID